MLPPSTSSSRMDIFSTPGREERTRVTLGSFSARGCGAGTEGLRTVPQLGAITVLIGELRGVGSEKGWKGEGWL